jgi:hypothetical protein
VTTEEKKSYQAWRSHRDNKQHKCHFPQFLLFTGEKENEMCPKRRDNKIITTKQKTRKGGRGSDDLAQGSQFQTRRDDPMTGMATPAALLLSNHFFSPSPSTPRRLLLLRPPGLLRPRTCVTHHHDKRASFSSPSSPRLRRHALRPPGAAAATPVIAAGDHWGNWAFLLSAAAFGTWYVSFGRGTQSHLHSCSLTEMKDA